MPTLQARGRFFRKPQDVNALLIRHARKRSARVILGAFSMRRSMSSSIIGLLFLSASRDRPHQAEPDLDFVLV
jgi:hypothetical protein